jgi:predicted O-methyltransferase YrrM
MNLRAWINRPKEPRAAHRDRPELTEQEIESALDPLAPGVRNALLSMYRGEPQLGMDGERHALKPDTRVSPSEGMWLYYLCLSVRPKATIEIGMAYGYSALYFLAAHAKCGSGHHTAIDPCETSLWHGIGLAQVRAAFAGMPKSFTFLDDRSDRVATDLAREGRRFDIVFIDGPHLFDHALMDFYLYAPLCTVGGYVVLDDVWMPSIRTLVDFVRANRQDFAELPAHEHNIAVFRRIAEDARSWRHFRQFPVQGDID